MPQELYLTNDSDFELIHMHSGDVDRAEPGVRLRQPIRQQRDCNKDKTLLQSPYTHVSVSQGEKS